MVRRYRSADGAASTLSSSVNSTTNTWPLASVSSFPAEGDFFVRCEGEIAKATSVSGSSLIVERAQSGTSASSHGASKDVVSVITKEDIEGRMNEAGLIRGMPYGKIVEADGTILTASDFSLINGASSSIVDNNDGVIEFRVESSSTNEVHGCTRPFTVNVDCDIYAHFQVVNLDTWPFTAGATGAFGLWTRANTGGAMKGISIYQNWKVAAQERTTFLTSPTDVALHGAEGKADAWFKMSVRWNIVADTDSLKVFYSWDGIHWRELYEWQFAFGSFDAGLFVSNPGQSDKAHFIDAWLEDITV